MKTSTFIIASLYLFSTFSFGQNLTKEFHLTQPVNKVNKSWYSYAEVLDTRSDTSNFGIVQLGAFNRKARLVAKPSLQQQLSNIITLLVDSSAGKDTILIHVRNISFSEVTGNFSERGYCHLRIGLYQRKKNLYSKICETDTTLITKAADVTQENIRKSGSYLLNFISENLARNGTDSDYLSKSQLQNLDSVEKSRLPLYTNPKLTPGVYYTYTSFKYQKPDTIVNLDVSINDAKFTLREIDQNGKKRKLNPEKIYAIVQPDQSYLGTPTGFYLLTKTYNDFYIVAKAKVRASSEDVVLAGIMFGVVGSILASDASAVYEMKIDHYSGNFIKIKEIQHPPTW